MQQSYRSRGSGQPQKLRFPRFSRPHSFVYSEHQPKECAGSRKEKERKETKKNKKKVKERRLERYRAERARAKGKGEGCHSHAPTLNEHSPSAFPLQAGGSADIPIKLAGETCDLCLVFAEDLYLPRLQVATSDCLPRPAGAPHVGSREMSGATLANAGCRFVKGLVPDELLRVVHGRNRLSRFWFLSLLRNTQGVALRRTPKHEALDPKRGPNYRLKFYKPQPPKKPPHKCRKL